MVSFISTKKGGEELCESFEDVEMERIFQEKRLIKKVYLKKKKRFSSFMALSFEICSW